jgi:hypothetical protein
MDTLKTRTLHGEEWVNLRDFHSLNTNIFGKLRKPEDIIEKANLKPGLYEYVVFGPDNTIKIVDEEDNTSKKVFMPLELVKTMCEHEREYDDTPQYPPAPEILDVPLNERLEISKGVKADIETRGTRDINGCLFSAIDIGKVFNLSRLVHRLSQNDRYLINQDYVIRTVTIKRGDKQVKKTRYFLTMEGTIRVLVNRRSPHTGHFIRWVVSIIHTTLMGSTKDRVRLASKLTGIAVLEIENALKKCHNDLNGLYLVNLGKICDIKEWKKYLDDTFKEYMYFIKYGRSGTIGKRLGNHRTSFGELEGANLEVIGYGATNVYLNSTSEKIFRQKLLEFCKPFPKCGHDEVLAVKKKDLGKLVNILKQVIDEFPVDPNKIQLQIAELQKKESQLKKTILSLQSSCEITNMKLAHAIIETDQLRDRILHQKIECDLAISQIKRAHAKEISHLNQIHAKDQVIHTKEKQVLVKENTHLKETHTKEKEVLVKENSHLKESHAKEITHLNQSHAKEIANLIQSHSKEKEALIKENTHLKESHAKDITILKLQNDIK